MKKIMINREHILTFITGLIMISDEDFPELIKTDFSKNGNMRNLIQKYIVPNFLEYPKIYKQVLKDNLEYYLVTKDDDIFNRTMDNIALNIPDRLKFYSLIWDELFHEPIPTSLNPNYFYEYNDSNDFANLIDLTGYREEIEDNQEQSK